MALTCRGVSAPGFVLYGTPAALAQWFGNVVVADKHDTGPEELAGLCQLGSNIAGVKQRRTLVGMLAPDPVWKKPVAVGNVKKVTHADPNRPRSRLPPVTNV